MTQEEKELLIKDLSARYPYCLKCKVRYWDGSGRLYVTGDMTLIGIIGNTCVFKTNFIRENTLSVDISEVKPYLRPMSSMTEEEKDYVIHLATLPCAAQICEKKVDFFNSHHIDWRGLIPMGLALEAPEGMYK